MGPTQQNQAVVAADLKNRLLTGRAVRRILALFGFGLAIHLCCGAQVNSNQASVNLNALLSESLTVAASPSTVNFALVSGAAALGSVPVAITTSWVLGVNRSTVRLYGWFAAPTAALTDGGSPANNIASTYVLGQVTTGLPATYTAFTQSNALGTSSGGLALISQAITSTNRASTRTDSLALKIDLTSLPQLPAGTYTGVITLQAQAL